MANTIFNARFTPTLSNTLSADTFEVDADIFDGTGTYSGLDVDLDDVVFLDTFNSVSAPQTISRYYVQSIVTQNVSTVTVVLKYEDSGSPVDPGEVTGNPGFIARRSATQKLAYHAAPTIHSFPDYITQFARDYDNYEILEDSLSSSTADASAIKGIFTNSSGSSIAALALVGQTGSGTLAMIDPSIESDVQAILGITVTPIANTASGEVVFEGLIKTITTGFSVSDVIYLSKTGTLSTTVPEIGTASFVSGDFIVQVGKITKNSDNPSNKDLLVEIKVIGQL